MAKTRTGTSSIWKHSLKIARLYQQFGASDLEARLGTPYADCIIAVVNCVIAALATDDYVLQVDRTLPTGPEDTPPL